MPWISTLVLMVGHGNGNNIDPTRFIIARCEGGKKRWGGVIAEQAALPPVMDSDKTHMGKRAIVVAIGRGKFQFVFSEETAGDAKMLKGLCTRPNGAVCEAWGQISTAYLDDDLYNAPPRPPSSGQGGSVKH